MKDFKMYIDNLILINGGAYKDVKKALGKWIKIYSENLDEDLNFRLFKNGRSNHVIEVDARLDNDMFYYLINYLKYPEEIDYRINIEGFTKGKQDNKVYGKNLLVYISPTDEEYDNVYIVTSDNENYKMDFGHGLKETREKKKFEPPPNLILQNPQLIKVGKRTTSKASKNNNAKVLSKRYRIISLIALVMWILSLIIRLFDYQLFEQFSFFIGLGFGVWFLTDYEILQSGKLYSLSLGISLLYLSYTVMINDGINRHVFDFGALLPVSLLLIQKPLRLIFITIFTREPIVDRPPPTVWDFVYTIILLLGMIILPFHIFEYITG